MMVSLRPRHLGVYRDIARLLIRYGRSDLVKNISLEGLEAPTDVSEDESATGERLAADLEAMGPTFVKLGQLLSTRVDLLPPSYTSALSRLQDKVAPFPYEEVASLIETELGTDVKHAFASFDSVPVAAASLGQVHRATLHSGREVVVKVQRPGVRAQIEADLEALTEIAQLLDKHSDVGRRYGFADLVAEFERRLHAELDYRREAANLTEMARILQPWERLMVPAHVPDYSSARVLTMDYVPGRTVNTIGPLGAMDFDGAALVDDLFHAYLHQIVVEGTFHADPHPGNAIVTSDGRLALIDLGMVATVSARHQDYIVKLLLAVSDGNADGVAEALVAMGTSLPTFDESGLHTRVAEMLLHASQLGEKGDAGVIVLSLTRICADSGLRPPPELSLVGKALLDLDELARHLDPDFSPAEAMRRHIGSIMQARMGASTGSLLASAMEARDFTLQLPARLNKVMDAVGDGKLELKVNALDEPQFLALMQRLANRMALALVISAVVVGAALMMQVPTKARILGYPSVAVIFFLGAAAGGLALITSIVRADRRISRSARQGR